MQRVGVLVGRFQPFHNGHLFLVNEALKQVDCLLIVLGSSQESRTVKNPWTVDERIEMIQAACPDMPLHCVGIPDSIGPNEISWFQAIEAAAADVAQGCTIVLFGHSKDESSYYLQGFPHWPYVELPDFQGLHATTIRTAYFNTGKIPEDTLPPAVADFIKTHPPFHTLLGVDFGLKRIGLAMGQTVTKTASPIGILNAHQGHASAEDVKKIIDIWRPNAIVIGIPLNMNGSLSPIATPAEAFAQWLESETQLPVFRADERLTTKAARCELAEFARVNHSKRRSAPVDAYAAVLILEAWLHA